MSRRRKPQRRWPYIVVALVVLLGVGAAIMFGAGALAQEEIDASLITDPDEPVHTPNETYMGHWLGTEWQSDDPRLGADIVVEVDFDYAYVDGGDDIWFDLTIDGQTQDGLDFWDSTSREVPSTEPDTETYRLDEFTHRQWDVFDNTDQMGESLDYLITVGHADMGETMISWEVELIDHETPPNSMVEIEVPDDMVTHVDDDWEETAVGFELTDPPSDDLPSDTDEFEYWVFIAGVETVNNVAEFGDTVSGEDPFYIADYVNHTELIEVWGYDVGDPLPIQIYVEYVDDADLSDDVQTNSHSQIDERDLAFTDVPPGDPGDPDPIGAAPSLFDGILVVFFAVAVVGLVGFASGTWLMAAAGGWLVLLMFAWRTDVQSVVMLSALIGLLMVAMAGRELAGIVTDRGVGMQ